VRRWAGAAGVLLALALLALMGAWREQGSPLGAPAAAVVASTSERRMAAAPPPTVVAAASVPTAAPTRADSPWKTEPLELCGVGTVAVAVPVGAPPRLPGDTPELPPHLGAYALATARADLLAALAAGPPRWQAAAALMADDATALRRIALAGQDPLVLAWATARCRDEPACVAEPLARWLALEPGNLVPWTQLWQSQPARREEAVAGLRQATGFRGGWAQLAEIVIQAMPAHVLPYLQVALIVEAVSVEAALPDPTPFTLLKLCRPPPERGSRRQGECEAWARLLTAQGSTLMAHMIGLRLGELAGWPPEHTEPQRRELTLVSMVAASRALNAEQPYSCDGAQRMRHWVQQVAQRGELAAMRAAASAPGR